MLIFGHALSAEMDIRSNTLDGGGYPGMRIRSITAICANLCSQPDTHKYGKQLSRTLLSTWKSPKICLKDRLTLNLTDLWVSLALLLFTRSREKPLPYGILSLLTTIRHRR